MQDAFRVELLPEGVHPLDARYNVIQWVHRSTRGWSYGGTMAAYALTHSKKFRLGIAGGAVYDWRLYDTIYTERFMSTPQANAGYHPLAQRWRASQRLPLRERF